jgi:signal transduction histidine kinase
MGWLSVRRPQGRDAVAAVIFAVLYFGALWAAFKYGWHPANPDYRWQVKLAGAATVAVLLTRERWPLSTFLAATLLYPAVHGTHMKIEFDVLPVLLAAYTVAARGRLRTVWALLLTEVAVTQMLWPITDLISMLRQPELIWWTNPSRIVLVQSVALLFVLLGRASYRHRQTTAQLVARNDELQRLRRVETDQVVTAERTRIARELHDVVAHHISAVVIRAQAADRVADNRPEETREAVRWIAANGQETLAAMRQVVRVLRSAESTGSLVPQTTLAELPEIAERMAAVGLPVELRLPAVVPALPAAVELATVRIIQEALTNVLVHAKATRALVELSLTGDELRLQVHDNGAAESPPTMPLRLLAAAAGAALPPERPVAELENPDRPAVPRLPPAAVLGGKAVVEAKGVIGGKSVLGGNGLIGMRERAASCGGVLTIGTSPLGGWLVSATLRVSLPAAADLSDLPDLPDRSPAARGLR